MTATSNRRGSRMRLAATPPTSGPAFVAVRHIGADWPFLVVVQSYAAHAVATDCGAVLVPETRRLFLAAGERLLAYDITPDQPRRLWEDTAECGFWNWRVHDGLVLMAAGIGVCRVGQPGHQTLVDFCRTALELPHRGRNGHVGCDGPAFTFLAAWRPFALAHGSITQNRR
jgi:hypothetical protein